MRTSAAAVALAAVLCSNGCQAPPSAVPPGSAARAALPPEVSVRPWSLPALAHAAQPDLALAADGGVLLSWIEPAGDGHTLKFARYADGRWSAAQRIADGNDWFVNWADTPHIAQTADGALWAHWLQKSAAATYAYDVALVRSGDGGQHWSVPVLVNDDGTATEHGFVSLWPMAGGLVGVAWLDGRRTADAGAGHGEDPHAGHGAAAPASPAAMMTLRTTTFDAAMQRGAEHELDLSTCDCCQTDVVPTATGALLAYRDRTAAEIRDIQVARFAAGHWQPAGPVHADNWTMPACPVNGPAIDARGTDALVGWYTAAGGIPMVRLAHSADGGATFAAPLTFDSGEAVQGRVDVALGTDAAWVLWLRETAGSQSLQLARYLPDLSQQLQRIEVATLQGRGRGTGFPQLALAADGTAYVVWTDVVDGRPGLHGALIAAE